ncbi:MAG: hypothetical protein A3I66_08435 [Burkholderiales bacterium RIFCSPLOWO2_02_FULL_57_36]|nr:MAG: hypothetical protein A3I66_08435 [Burkholderiales bacterium RIFCSPLOWO2_02_FULL_57_36]
MNKTAKRIVGAFSLSWAIGIACLFIALQFSPPRWSVDAMGGALKAAAESSLLYVLPPLLILAIWTWRKAQLSVSIAGLVALVWVILTVAWWASSFSPVPWAGALRNLVILLPGALIPSVAFYLLSRQR